MKVAFVSCTKLKADYPCSAGKMYQKSTLFKKAINYIKQMDYDNWFILSAKYGLIGQNDVIHPYDLTLNNMKASERKEWAELVLNQIEDLDIKITHIDFYAGEKYRQYLIPTLNQKGIVCNVPLEGKGMGEQLHYYSVNTK